ncbi:hypothetical protein [Spongiivirga citrea]|uniref:Uncharacterized protein n=1 Tax=Spongiivirga citrea TaxID=1481457 RepID=A0A6M0CEK1_9FLAO|nr:hypothetical protein [Spongiivirga citrea]NER15852.1 hypothetical protein [Spongiivirga citrea]
MKASVKWTLFRFIKEEWSGMDGMLLQPSKEFSIKLTDSFFREQLNVQNCFDFDYKPTEGDCIIFDLIIHGKVKYGGYKPEKKFISLIYDGVRWNIEQYDCFYTTIEETNSGYLKLKP